MPKPDPDKSAQASSDAMRAGAKERRRMVLAVTSLASGGAAATAVPFVSTLAPSGRALAAGAPVTVDVSQIRPGEIKTVEWRGKPVWIMRRTAEKIEALQQSEAGLVDPQSEMPQQPGYATNQTRSVRPDIGVMVGICTHLGCSPTAVAAGGLTTGSNGDWPGGFFCPCHGSKFDYAGRVYKNMPAPTNLVVPDYRFDDADQLVIGESDAASDA